MDCSQTILESHKEEFILEQVHLIAYSTGLFEEGDIKVRINPYKKFIVGNKSDNFIHVFAHVMQGRTTEQKADLSKLMVNMLTTMFPDVANIAMNISDFEKDTYCNRTML
jgi:5-carboxymethyl-2-hydroxymuconate isomerase